MRHNSITLDVRGQACPQPVVETKKALDGITEGIITVILDAEPSAVNVTRFAVSQGCSVSRTDKDDGTIVLDVAKGFVCELPGAGPAPAPSTPTGGSLLVYINDRFMGKGDEQLGAILMKAFLKTLRDLPKLPDHLVFVNGAVHLTTTGSEELDTIRALEADGVTVLSCGTCLDFFHLKDQLEVGNMSNMFEIASLLTAAGRIVTP
jgi:selenium metabolism protein YedF